VWIAITDFAMKLHSSGLGHDAVIEIMIALLGLMIAVLTLIAGLFAAAVAIVGVFGFKTIKDETRRAAEKTAQRIAKDVAKSTATGIANTTLNELWSQIQASGMSEGQAEPNEELPEVEASADQLEALPKNRRKATSDINLKEGGQQ